MATMRASNLSFDLWVGEWFRATGRPTAGNVRSRLTHPLLPELLIRVIGRWRSDRVMSFQSSAARTGAEGVMASR